MRNFWHLKLKTGREVKSTFSYLWKTKDNLGSQCQNSHSFLHKFSFFPFFKLYQIKSVREPMIPCCDPSDPINFGFFRNLLEDFRFNTGSLRMAADPKAVSPVHRSPTNNPGWIHLYMRRYQVARRVQRITNQSSTDVCSIPPNIVIYDHLLCSI